jgi:hypothetical protein
VSLHDLIYSSIYYISPNHVQIGVNWCSLEIGATETVANSFQYKEIKELRLST